MTNNKIFAVLLFSILLFAPGVKELAFGLRTTGSHGPAAAGPEPTRSLPVAGLGLMCW